MFEVIAARRQDDAGNAKLGKNPDSMNREWNKVYDPLFAQSMRTYEDAASRRIVREEREDRRNKKPAADSENRNRERSTDRAMPPELGGNEGLTTSRVDKATAQPSPNPSDYTDVTDTSVELILPVQSDAKPRRMSENNATKKGFCLDVNKPQGCPRGSACPKNHSNEGIFCNKRPCSFDKQGRCAFVHTGDPWVDRDAPAASHASSTVCQDPRTQNLTLILDQVLAYPKRFKVCTYLNKPHGCKSEKLGGTCGFNHTLKGVVCPDFAKHMQCPRGDFECPLLHFGHEQPTAGRSNSKNGLSRTALHTITGPPPLPLNQAINTLASLPSTRGLDIPLDVQCSSAATYPQPSNAPTPSSGQPETLPSDIDPPPFHTTPTNPQNKQSQRYTQNHQPPASNRQADIFQPTKRKRIGIGLIIQDLAPEARSLRVRMTRDPSTNQAATEYESDEDDDGDSGSDDAEPQRVHRPRKKQKQQNWKRKPQRRRDRAR